MHPNPPTRIHLGICGAMVAVGVVLIAVAAIFGHLWGPVRVLFVLAGAVLSILGFLLALGVTNLKVGASTDGGIQASADMPTGYTRTMTVSDSLVEGSSPAKFGSPPPKDGMMPPKEGTMPPKEARQASPEPLTRSPDEESSRDRPTSSAEP